MHEFLETKWIQLPLWPDTRTTGEEGGGMERDTSQQTVYVVMYEDHEGPVVLRVWSSKELAQQWLDSLPVRIEEVTDYFGETAYLRYRGECPVGWYRSREAAEQGYDAKWFSIEPHPVYD